MVYVGALIAMDITAGPMGMWCDNGLELIRRSVAPHISGIESNLKVFNGRLRAGGGVELYMRTSSAGLRRSHSTNTDQFRQRQPSDDEGAPLSKYRIVSSCIYYTATMASICCRQIHRCIITAIPAR